MRRTSRTGSRFQSTLPRGSDVIFNTMIKCILYISIHAPSRERPSYALALLLRGLISIHAPSRERRYIASNIGAGIKYFNPRSLTGATERQNGAPCVIYISIHAPSRERRKSKTCVLNNCYFNPRSLTGATTTAIVRISALLRFQSTLPYGSDRAAAPFA